MKELLERYRKEIYLGGLIFLVASIAFALGYQANRAFTRSPIIIEKCGTEAPIVATGQGSAL